MRVNRLGAAGAVLGWALLFFCGNAAAQTLSPSVVQVTGTTATITWSTTQALNTQLHYGVGNLNSSLASWGLVWWHSITLTGLKPGTTYSVEAESSYFSNPDLFSSTLTFTTPGGSNGNSAAGMSTPTVTPTSGGFTISWTTAQPLNSQVHFGQGNTSQSEDSWTLSTSHSVTVSNLSAGTFEVQAESSYFSNPDLLGPMQSVTVAGSSNTGSSSNVSSSSRMFTSSGTNWLYTAPSGSAINISSITGGMVFQVNDHTQGFDYPVEYTDGSHGCTTFNDYGYYSQKDDICVPNPNSGAYWPAVGGWGYDDGHLVVVNTSNGNYYDFWKLYVNGSGQPTSLSIGGIKQGNIYTSNGTPGTTAANITGLAGDIMPGELDCETCLNHALQVIVPSSMNSNQVGQQSSATKTDGSVPGAIFREGSKIRFDPSVNVDSLNASTAVKAIMRALQLYGGVITDQTGGSQIAFYSDLATPPDSTGIGLIGSHLFIYY